MKSRRGATFAEEGKWTPGADSTLLIGDWQAWVDGEGHWKVRGPNPDDEAHYADGDIELTEAEYIEAGNSEARRKIRARRAKEAARAYIKKMTQGLPSLWKTSKHHHATKKSPAQLQREIDEVLANPSAALDAAIAKARTKANESNRRQTVWRTENDEFRVRPMGEKVNPLWWFVRHVPSDAELRQR